MHLVAANIWTWIRYVLIEEGVMDREIRLVEIFSCSESIFPRFIQLRASPCLNSSCALCVAAAWTKQQLRHGAQQLYTARQFLPQTAAAWTSCCAPCRRAA